MGAQQNSSAEGDDLDIKKPKAESTGGLPPMSEQARTALSAAGAFLGGLAEASAQAFRSLNAKLEPDYVRSKGLTASAIEGLAEGNARFLEELAKASRMVAQMVRARDPKTIPSAPEIDYDRLAKLVAAELAARSGKP